MSALNKESPVSSYYETNYLLSHYAKINNNIVRKHNKYRNHLDTADKCQHWKIITFHDHELYSNITYKRYKLLVYLA